MAKLNRPLIPTGNLRLSYVSIATDTLLHRVHHSDFGATQFNDTSRGDARFSPITDATGTIIPTLYAGETFECAAMETVFHEVPFEPGLKTQQQSLMEGNLYSQVRACSALRLVDLSSKALRQLGVQRRHLIDTDSEDYPYTRQWAQIIHAQAPDVQGLQWISRQDDRAFAVVLFGDRIDPAALALHEDGRSLLADPRTFAAIIDLAMKIGVELLPF